MSETFKGMYYKHQKDSFTVSIIIGCAASGSFVQVITNEAAYQHEGAAGCIACKSGISLHLPTIRGTVAYGPLLPLRSDIMGPFRFLPMQCRHTVQSMAHSLRGGFWIDGRYLDFTGGLGYIEGDCGRSFPKQYLWLHCNHFPVACSIMVSVADIPFGTTHFTGCLCVVCYAGQEYRLATYCGVRIITAQPDMLILSQGRYLLIAQPDARAAQPLIAPQNGRMTQTVHESNCTHGRFRFWANGMLLFDLTSEAVSFEVRDAEQSK